MGKTRPYDIKSGKPNALLSRSVAGVAGKTIIYALPGSVKAVNEYMAEITRSMKHTLYGNIVFTSTQQNEF